MRAPVQHDAQLDYYGRRLATCSSDRTIKIFEIGEDEQQSQQPSAILNGCVRRRSAAVARDVSTRRRVTFAILASLALSVVVVCSAWLLMRVALCATRCLCARAHVFLRFERACVFGRCVCVASRVVDVFGLQCFFFHCCLFSDTKVLFGRSNGYIPSLATS